MNHGKFAATSVGLLLDIGLGWGRGWGWGWSALCTDAVGSVLAPSLCPGASTWQKGIWRMISCMSSWLKSVEKQDLSGRRNWYQRGIKGILTKGNLIHHVQEGAEGAEEEEEEAFLEHRVLGVGSRTYGSVQCRGRSWWRGGLLLEFPSWCSGLSHMESQHSPPETSM